MANQSKNNQAGIKPKSNNTLLGTSIYIGVSLLLLAAILISIVVAVAMGTTNILTVDVYSVIGHKLLKWQQFDGYAKGSIHDIIWLIRLPRVVLAVAVGGGLAVCGAVMQAVVKNPMAGPYTLGISSGASLGATMAILLGVGVSFGANYVGAVAFVGAFGAALLVMFIAELGSRANTVKLLLAGIAISSVFSAFSSFIVYMANDKEGIQSITYWLMGSLAGANWETMPAIYIVVLGGSIFFMTQYRTLNMMLLGDEVSITLGTSLHTYRRIYMLVSALMIGFVVFSSGIIGFVGLIVPHFVRIFFGSDHKKVIPLALLVGGLFMIWADVLSRTIIPHVELPIGILVSMIGAPTFIYLLLKKTYGFGG